MVRSLCVCIHILCVFTGRYSEEFVSKRKEKLKDGVIELVGTQ